MGKVETYTQNRVEGLAWALDLIMGEETIEKGVEMLKKEVVFRRASFMSLEMKTKAIEKCDEILRNHMMNSILIAFLKLFEEEYGWRKVRLQRLMEDFAKHTNDLFDVDPYGERYVEISDYAKYFADTYGIQFDAKILDAFVQAEQMAKDQRSSRIEFSRIEKHLKNSYPEALEHLRKVLKL